MVRLDLLDCIEEVLVLALLLRLELGEFFGVIEHASTVLVTLLLDLVLLLVQKLPPLNLFSVLRFFDLPQERLLLVLSLLLLALKLTLLLADARLLRFHSQLNVNLHISIFLVLTFGL